MTGLAELVFDTADLRRFAGRLERAVLEVARDTVRDEARSLERQYENAFEAAGAGKLSRAWASAVFPKTGLSEAPTGTVFPKGKARTRGAVQAFAGGARIKSRSGDLLAIPLRAAGRRFAGRGKVPLSPREWEQRTGLELYPVKLKGKLYLATDGIAGRKTGRVAVAATQRRLAQGRAVKRLLIFILLPPFDFAQRVNLDGLNAAAQASLPRTFLNRFQARVDALEGAGGA
ncbi:DUF6441 family protein [Sandarakinorhabdus sp.]|uniref:DUF6441 family protein n=1 Tax=Sandarakinorhabdus sp. TaxID=1916663 RepID=UPI00286E5466|nr:DUF6441 family protein [Sandarakinorhabdus sp.]